MGGEEGQVSFASICAPQGEEEVLRTPARASCKHKLGSEGSVSVSTYEGIDCLVLSGQQALHNFFQKPTVFVKHIQEMGKIPFRLDPLNLCNVSVWHGISPCQVGLFA